MTSTARTEVEPTGALVGGDPADLLDLHHLRRSDGVYWRRAESV